MATRQIKKTSSKTKVENPIIENSAEVIVEEKTVKKKFDPTDVINCKSIVAGELILNGSKSGGKYVWNDIGDYCEVEYRDLASLVRASSDYINKPYFIIEDDDFLSEFPRVRDVYDTLYSVGDLKEVLRMPVGEMKSVISILPDGAKSSIRNLATTMISNGQLDSVKKIKALDNIFDTKLEVLTGLFD